MDAATNQEKTAFVLAPETSRTVSTTIVRAAARAARSCATNSSSTARMNSKTKVLGSQGATVTMPTATGITQLEALNPDAAVLAILKEFPAAPAKSGTTLVNGIPIDVGQYAGVAPASPINTTSPSTPI